MLLTCQNPIKFSAWATKLCLLVAIRMLTLGEQLSPWLASMEAFH